MTALKGIKPLKLEVTFQGNPMVVHATLLWDENDVILVDTGLPGYLQVLQDVLAEERLSLDKLTKIIITHQDFDHIGGLPELIEAGQGKIEVLAHELAKPYIQGEVPLIKGGFLVPSSKVDVTLHDGDVLPYAGGIQVIFTPGHTPDHISLYHASSKTLISGDALTSEGGVLAPPAPEYTLDMPSALQSISKLLNLDIETVITYHGGVCTEQIKERMASITANKRG